MGSGGIAHPRSVARRQRVRVACVQLQAHEVDDAEQALALATEACARAAREADVVVLPEATYPGYVLHDETAFLDPGWWRRGVDAFAQVAQESGAYVVVGLIRPVDGRLRNSAAVLSPEGAVVGVVDKSFLWHFDSLWFAEGEPGKVLPLPFGDTGVLVCADARMMEIPRSLAAAGARLLCDPTALVLNAAGTNAQVEYMLAARAWENGAFLAVANKCGYEAGIAHYAGRSAIFDPEGRRLAEGPAHEPAIVTAEIDLGAATGPRSAGRAREGAPSGSRLEVDADTTLPTPPVAPLRIAVVQEETDERRILRELGADLVVTRRDLRAERVLAVTGRAFRFGASTYAGGDLLDCGDAIIGLLADDGLSDPEQARALMLAGADVVVWDRPAGDRTPESVIRTRADENRVFLVVTSSDFGWTVVAPNGSVLAQRRGADRLQAVLVELPLALARSKEMAPGTDVVANRRPDVYAALTRME